MNPSSSLVPDPAFTDQVSDDGVLLRARTRFLVTSLVMALAVGVIAFLAIDAIARRAARDDATTRAALVAAVVGAWTDAVGDPERRSELSDAVDAVSEHQGVDHVVVWRADGSVAWADYPAMVGRTFRMHQDMKVLFAGTDSTLVDRPGANTLESADSPMEVSDDLEIFSATVDRDGEPLVVESYVNRASLNEHRRQTLWLVLPYVLAVLVLLEVTCLSLGGLLVRQVRRGRQGRIRVTTDALRAMEKERRELAHELHDGIVQDLAATRYALAAIASSLPEGLSDDPQTKLQRIQDVLKDELVDLRGLLGHLVPADLESRSLEQALRAVVRHLVPPESSCRLDVECPALTHREARVVYRVVREGVANAVKHGRASTIHVAVRSHGATGPGGPAEVTVLVEDDGSGLPAGPLRDPDQHFGLGLVAGLLGDHGGRLVVTGRDDAPGTRLLARFPLSSPVLV